MRLWLQNILNMHGTGITIPREPFNTQEYVSVIVHMSSHTLNTGIVFQSPDKNGNLSVF
jgi:hypothetical protein